MNTADLFETETYGRLTGYLDVRGLAALLGIENLTTFEDAIDKIRLGQGDDMALPQITELAHAFIRLLGMDAAQKTKLIGRLLAVRVAPNAQEPANGNGAQQATTVDSNNLPSQ